MALRWSPGRRAFVDIIPATTEADRAFTVRHWDYDERCLSTDDYDVGAELVRSARADNEQALVSLLQEWGTPPNRFDYPWNTADPL